MSGGMKKTAASRQGSFLSSLTSRNSLNHFSTWFPLPLGNSRIQNTETTGQHVTQECQNRLPFALDYPGLWVGREARGIRAGKGLAAAKNLGLCRGQAEMEAF